mmetsp:Transcript_11293/g.33481  ORF Transcript_11293/g.33481 Transcript_11293/m.33481 type:complete len:80 (+) Transcript_11293:185-424(+)
MWCSCQRAEWKNFASVAAVSDRVAGSYHFGHLGMRMHGVVDGTNALARLLHQESIFLPTSSAHMASFELAAFAATIASA